MGLLHFLMMLNEEKEKEEKKKDEELEEEMDEYGLEENEKELVREGEYMPWDFDTDPSYPEDEYTEEDEYYKEDFDYDD